MGRVKELLPEQGDPVDELMRTEPDFGNYDPLGNQLAAAMRDWTNLRRTLRLMERTTDTHGAPHLSDVQLARLYASRLQSALSFIEEYVNMEKEIADEFQRL